MKAFIGFFKFCARAANNFLEFFDLRLSRIPRNYIAAWPTINAAKKAGKSICDYLEDGKSKEQGQSPKIKGRRDRIIKQMKEAGVFENCDSVLEIGAGTGMYLEKVKTETRCQHHEIYEIDKQWSKFLAKKYGVQKKNCDGFSLKETADKSISLVHAHAVFVYIPFLTTLDYLTEIFRVVKDNGSIVFDVMTENSFKPDLLLKWENQKHRFPVIIPEKILLDHVSKNNFYVYKRFNEVYGPGISEYFILKKKGNG